MKVALATCMTPPEPDVDETALVTALEARGVEVRMLAWDHPSDRPRAGELVVLRSTWNYYRDVAGFLGWVERTAETTRLLNPAAIVRRNAEKTYLRDLADQGVAVVPTEFVSKGASGRHLLDAVRDRGWEKIVIKPVVSAGSFQTRCFERSESVESAAFLDALTSERDAMIQRWMPSVESYGERSLIWIDGALTHAIRKSPRFAGGAEGVSGEQPIRPEERAFAEKLLAPIAEDLLYARVDVVWDEATLRLMELELIEPSLFLQKCPTALDRLVDAIVAHAARGVA